MMEQADVVASDFIKKLRVKVELHGYNWVCVSFQLGTVQKRKNYVLRYFLSNIFNAPPLEHNFECLTMLQSRNELENYNSQ